VAQWRRPVLPGLEDVAVRRFLSSFGVGAAARTAAAAGESLRVRTQQSIASLARTQGMTREQEAATLLDAIWRAVAPRLSLRHDRWER
jgi:hypothetical protein